MDNLVKSYCRLNLLGAFDFHYERLDIFRDSIIHSSKKLLSFECGTTSIFNLERLDILRDSIGHLSIKLLSFEFAQSFCSQFRASRYIIGLNRTSE